ncbi:MAG: uncharacterized protein QG673_706 [Pseudomonadota bacterium]|nr:uncharacterized protein [Pseudomonadota bacterium]
MQSKIIITGASGFIATELRKYFNDRYSLILVSREANHSRDTYSWNDIENSPQLLADAKCIINLSGANIGDKRWTNKQKQLIIDSRINTTAILIKALNTLRVKPDLLCASAVGIYPIHGIYDEYSNIDYNHYDSFSQKVTKLWENMANTYTGRVVNMRFGVVLSGHGGALGKILLPFRIGVGSGISKGNWLFSWISIIDLCRAIDYLIEQPQINGPVNLVAPQCITYKNLIDTISSVYSKKCWFNLPGWLIKVIFGQMGAELLLSGQHVIPKLLIQHGFKFIHADINNCISDIHEGKI